MDLAFASEVFIYWF